MLETVVANSNFGPVTPDEVRKLRASLGTIEHKILESCSKIHKRHLVSQLLDRYAHNLGYYAQLTSALGGASISALQGDYLGTHLRIAFAEIQRLITAFSILDNAVRENRIAF